MGSSTKKLSPFSLFWEIFVSEKNFIKVVVTYEIGVGILSLTIPIGVQTVVNTLAFTQLVQPIVFLAFAVLAGQLVVLCFRSIQVIMIERLQKRLFANTGMELAYRLPRISKEYAPNLHELVNRFFDIVTIQKNFSFLILEGFSLALQILVGLVLLAFYHPALLAFDIILVLSIFFIIFVLGRNGVKTSIAESYEKYNLVAWLEQIASKSNTFSSKASRYFALQRANEVVGDYLEARDAHFKVVFRQVVGFLTLQSLANTSLLILGVWLVSNFQLTIGQLVASEIVVSTVLYSFSRFQKHLDNYYDLVAAIDKVGNLLSLPYEAKGTHFETLPESYRIEFSDVVYKAPLTNHAIGPMTFALEQGEKLAISGANGSGKSTILNLLYGYKTFASGLITYGGNDIRLICNETLREQVCLVRNIEIVQATILQNILISSPRSRLEEVNDVLSHLGLYDDFMKFKEGLNTELMEDGAPLSVSQSKRLMLARAIIQNPNVLLIDEILDGLDDVSRANVIEFLFKRSREMSIIVVTKHPDVISVCNNVYYL